MIEERAVILSLETVSNQSVATLEIARRTACGLCGQTRGCGNSMWGKLFAHQSSAFKATNSIDAKIGQTVVVGINEKALLHSAFLLYIVPLAFMFFAAIVVNVLLHSESLTIAAAMLGLLLGLVWVKGFTTGRQYFLLNQPEILKVASDDFDIKCG
jgi:sigma-E factor negative regulatory protein RseC